MTILQSRLSGMYFKDFGLWVAHAVDALQFETAEGARKFVAVEHLADVTLLNSPGESEELNATTRHGGSMQGALEREHRTALF